MTEKMNRKPGGGVNATGDFNRAPILNSVSLFSASQLGGLEEGGIAGGAIARFRGDTQAHLSGCATGVEGNYLEVADLSHSKSGANCAGTAVSGNWTECVP